jgi:hypothetical protein
MFKNFIIALTTDYCFYVSCHVSVPCYQIISLRFVAFLFLFLNVGILTKGLCVILWSVAIAHAEMLPSQIYIDLYNYLIWSRRQRARESAAKSRSVVHQWF